MTPLDALVESLEAASRFDPSFQARPEAVLWCDPESAFAPVIPILRQRMPHLFTLGVWDPDTRTGPAFQLRAECSRAEGQGGAVPVLWFPGVGRDTLRNALDCPEPLEPLAWLTASGSLFGHVNGKDWTLRGFLTAERGSVRLDIADGAEAREALALAAPILMGRPFEMLLGRRFDVEALHALTAPDPNDEMLAWIEGKLDQATEPARFKAFAARAAKSLSFDPRKRARQDAVRAMAERQGAWAAVWERYEHAAEFAFPETTNLLGVEEPPGTFDQHETFPKANQASEGFLRDDLLKLATQTNAEAKASIFALEGQHGFRRKTIWGRRGQAALASALEHLVAVAGAPGWAASDPEALARDYVAHGATVDRAAMLAIAAAPHAEDRAAVTAVLRAVYLPWLDQGARVLQDFAAAGKTTFGLVVPVPDAVTAVVFVDGLRFDLAQRLVARLDSLGAKPSLGWRWSGFPTSTACCKPLVSPVADALTGIGGEAALAPMTADGKLADHRILMKALEERGFGRGEDDERLWLEIGDFDEDGHSLGVRLADQLTQGLEDAAQRLMTLARGGRRIRVVTDHGWLLVPGGLETAKLGTGLAEPDEKRTRYARLKEGAPTQHAQASWSWNPAIRLAMAPGAASFYAGLDYAHGGVSPQECIIPVIDIEPLATVAKVEILETSWANLRLRVKTSGAVDMTVDLRPSGDVTGPSMAAKVATIGEDGKASVMALDTYEDQAAIVVVLDDEGRILARQIVRVGG